MAKKYAAWREIDPGSDRCLECGAQVSGGRGACQGLFDQLTFQATSDPRIAEFHRLAFDAYCMQHVETYCASAKSYAAHLMGLCCGCDYGGDPPVYDVIHRWLNGKATVEKPPLLAERGALKMTDISLSAPVEQEIDQIKAWAADVWRAYEPQHETARQWIKQALAHRPSRR